MILGDHQVFMNNSYRWWNARLDLTNVFDDVTSKYVPPHVNLFFCLGGLTLLCFLVQIATGFGLTLYYLPSVARAYNSVVFLQSENHLGWLLRSVHRWRANGIVLSMLLHIFRVYLTGSFKAPRELTWVSGAILAVLTVSFGVTGYRLPWDQTGFWAAKIVTGTPESLPLVGSAFVQFLRGGLSLGQRSLNRFYSLHTFIFPLISTVFMFIHFFLIRKQGISGPL